ncbi:unnamed protein product [Amoebophrya sp. A120]|nr:unnamed protein product [Amoebophrya sp. A120]|eukprot:GSA120T00001816001.1
MFCWRPFLERARKLWEYLLDHHFADTGMVLILVAMFTAKKLYEFLAPSIGSLVESHVAPEVSTLFTEWTTFAAEQPWSAFGLAITLLVVTPYNNFQMKKCKDMCQSIQQALAVPGVPEQLTAAFGELQEMSVAPPPGPVDKVSAMRLKALERELEASKLKIRDLEQTEDALASMARSFGETQKHQCKESSGGEERTKTNAENEVPTCAICWSEAPTVLWTKCRHLVACGACGDVQGPQCPMCRTTGPRVRIFYA